MDDNFFEKIDTEEKAYWLGFISADGCIYTKKNSGSKILEVSLQKGDISHLHKLQKSIKSNYPIVEKTNSYQFSVVSRKIYQDLHKYGITERKTKTLKPPKDGLIPKELINHYIRGIFDGDGGFSISKDGESYTYSINFCGTIDVVKYIRNILDLENIKLHIPENIDNYAEWKIKGNKQTLRVAKYIYKNSTLYLDRKYENYQNLILLNEINSSIKELNQMTQQINEIKMTKDLINGLTGREIAKKYKCSESEVSRIVKRYRTKQRESKAQIVIDLYNQGYKNKSEIHRITGFSRDYIRKVFKQLS